MTQPPQKSTRLSLLLRCREHIAAHPPKSHQGDGKTLRGVCNSVAWIAGAEPGQRRVGLYVVDKREGREHVIRMVRWLFEGRVPSHNGTLILPGLGRLIVVCVYDYPSLPRHLEGLERVATQITFDHAWGQ